MPSNKLHGMVTHVTVLLKSISPLSPNNFQQTPASTELRPKPAVQTQLNCKLITAK